MKYRLCAQTAFRGICVSMALKAAAIAITFLSICSTVFRRDSKQSRRFSIRHNGSALSVIFGVFSLSILKQKKNNVFFFKSEKNANKIWKFFSQKREWNEMKNFRNEREKIRIFIQRLQSIWDFMQLSHFFFLHAIHRNL